MGAQEYSTFVTLLRLLIIMGIPSAALQTVFAGQTAAVTNERKEQQLIATTRSILAGTFLIWLASALAVLAVARPLSHLLKISQPAALYFTVLLALTSLWIPIVKGLLQGQHRFGGLGWLQISDGVGRFFIMLLIIFLFAGKAAGAMFAALAGQFVTVVIGLDLTRSIWGARPAVAFDAKGWLREAVPLTLGLGTVLLDVQHGHGVCAGLVRGHPANGPLRRRDADGLRHHAIHRAGGVGHVRPGGPKRGAPRNGATA